MSLPPWVRRLAQPTAPLGPHLAFTLLAMAWSGAARGDQPLPDVPRIDCPIYVMEYHVWYRSPAGSHQPGYVHWGNPERIDDPAPDDPSVRDIGAEGYPLLGLYDSENTDVIRWQLRCAHQAGIDGLFVQLFPDNATGTYLGGSQIFATILKIAGEEHVKVAAHDEVMFRNNTPAQKAGPMATRISQFLQRYGSDPAYLKIDGHPVYAFQYWSHFLSPPELAACLDHAEQLAGEPIHFLIMGGGDSALYQRHSPSSFVVAGNSPFEKADDAAGKPDLKDWLRLSVAGFDLAHLRASYPAQKFGLWAYPGFDNRPQSRASGDPHFRTFLRQGGKILAQTLETYNRSHPDFMMLSSWNDWMENTALEPGYRYDSSGPSPDPYLYCRILAKAKGFTFTPPPLPPREAVDPMRGQSLYGVGGLPPKLKESDFSPSHDRLSATWIDAGSPVASSIAVTTGEAWIDFAHNSGHGLHLEGDPARITAGTGFLLSNKTVLRLESENLPATGGDWYLAVQFQGQASGTLKIAYTASPPVLDFREFDGTTFPVDATLTIGGAAVIVTQVARLRAADFSLPGPYLSINFVPKDAGAANQSLYIRRVDLLRAPSAGVVGKSLTPAPAPHREVVFEYDFPDKPASVFLFAHDTWNNWSPPLLVDGSGNGTPP